jgi:hypothetical protein
MMTSRILALGAALAVLAAPATARAERLMRLVPADAFVVISGRPALSRHGRTSEEQANRAVVIQRLLSVGARLDLLPEEAQAIADILGCLPLLAEHPYAFVLMDVTSKPLPGGAYRLNTLQAAILFETHGDNTSVIRRIRELLAGYTHTDVTRLEKVAIGGVSRYQLYDTRLPEWAVIEWGPIDDQFIVSIGQGAFDRLLRVRRGEAMSLADDAWYQSIRARVGADDAFMQWMIAFAALRDRLAEVVRGRPEAVLRSLGADRMGRAIWTVRTEARAITIYCAYETQNRTRVVRLSGPAGPGTNAAAAIPDAARGYALARVPITEWLLRFRDAYLDSQHERTREALRALWADLERTYGFSAQDDLLAHLGDRFLVHDYPPHPFGLPLLWTYMIETDGQTEPIRRAIDGMMRAWHDALAPAPDPTNPNARPGGLQLRRTQDGIWYFRFGLAGPAIAVEGRWIIIGFSPAAVRENIAYLRAAATPATTPAAVDTFSGDR